MALNRDLLGKKVDLEPVAFSYTEDNVILYALGVGAGPDELDFIYEKNLKVLPTFAVLQFMPIFLNSFVPASNLNMFQMLHGEHKIIFHRPIPKSGHFRTSTLWESVYDKGDKGAILNLKFETTDQTGTVIFENHVVAVDRSAGNFGGDRGPRTEITGPPENKTPDFRVAYQTAPNQCALYRLSGDKNPLHIDPAFAAKGGFARPILHGLCTLGFAGRALLHSVCGSDPERLKTISVRFVSVAYPGDSLITTGWEIDDGRYVFETKNQDGKVILGNAAAKVGPTET